MAWVYRVPVWGEAARRIPGHPRPAHRHHPQPWHRRRRRRPRH